MKMTECELVSEIGQDDCKKLLRDQPVWGILKVHGRGLESETQVFVIDFRLWLSTSSCPFKSAIFVFELHPHASPSDLQLFFMFLRSR